MVIHMNETRLCSLEQLQAFLDGTAEVQFLPFEGDDARYAHIAAVLRRFGYRWLGRKHKSLALRYLVRTTGYSRQQVTRLVLDTGGIAKRYRSPAKGFARKYTAADVALLAETDALHDTLSDPATRHLMQRALQSLAIPATRGWPRSRWRICTTCGQTPATGRAASGGPRPGPRRSRSAAVARRNRRGAPGFLRIDSVHQGEQDGVKGVYHINVMDCVTQWEIVATCEKFSDGSVKLTPI
jgi:hypothetical protein